MSPDCLELESLCRTTVLCCLRVQKNRKNKSVGFSQVQSSAAADSEVRLGRQDFAFSAEEPELDPKGDESP